MAEYVYLDTSALVKRYVTEEHSELVRSWGDLIVTSELARVEFCSAVARKVKGLHLVWADADAIIEEFDADWGDGIVVLAPTSSILRAAADYASEHALRGYHAVHLATASAASEAVNNDLAFGCFDTLLNSAAAFHGLPILAQ